MGCNRQGLIGIVYDISTPSLVRGADCFVTTQVIYASDDVTPGLSPSRGSPYAFQSPVGSTAYFQADGGGAPVVSVGVLQSNDLGTFKFEIPASGSTGLAVGDAISFEQKFEDARGLTILVFDNLPVIDQLFP
jgi:hypothetical protein